MRRFVSALVFASFCVAGSAWAAPSAADKQKAAQSFQIGNAAYAKGDFAGAAAAFEKAAFYAPHPSTLLNAAESWELAENPARAAQLCDRVLDTPNLEPQHRQAAQKQLSRLENKIGTIVVKAPSKARIEVDDHEEREITRFRVATGAHKVKVTDAEGEPRVQSVTVSGGETRELDFLTPPPPKPEDTKPSPLVTQKRDEVVQGSGPPIASWVCFGAAAAAAGVGAYFGVKTLSAKDEFDARPTTAARDDFNSARLATDVAIGVAAVGIAIGLVLWATASPNGKTATSFSNLRGTW